MTSSGDTDLYWRRIRTMLAAWEHYARGAAGEVMHHCPGVAAAVFPHGPKRAFYNNALLLERELTTGERADTLDAMHAAYETTGIGRFAAWVDESNEAMHVDLLRRGYRFEESTCAMGMLLDEIRLPQTHIELGSIDWSECLRVLELPAT